MLIRKMVFIFHKSNQAYKRVTLTKLSTTINRTEVSFCSNEQFCSAFGYGADSIQDVRFRHNQSGCKKFAVIKCESGITASSGNPGIDGSNPIETLFHFVDRTLFPFKSIPCLHLFSFLQNEYHISNNYHTHYQPCKAELKLKIPVTLETIQRLSSRQWKADAPKVLPKVLV